ncbi:MAG: universal stress protein [Syntrophomonadaceae bacterium]|nr:universal stress protein [Syntrophomonadaceae bacterium]
MFQKALVAVDGSSSSFKAVNIASQMMGAGALNETTLLCVMHMPVPTFLGDGTAALELPGEYFRLMRDSAQQIIDQASEQMASNHKISSQIELGNPAEVILDLAQHGGYDLIIIGSRGLNQIQRLFMGSVSSKVVSLAHCPVLVVK